MIIIGNYDEIFDWKVLFKDRPSLQYEEWVSYFEGKFPFVQKGEQMTNRSRALPTRELRKNRAPAFCNGDEDLASKNLTRRDIASMAFRAVYADKLGDPPYIKQDETNQP